MFGKSKLPTPKGFASAKTKATIELKSNTVKVIGERRGVKKLFRWAYSASSSTSNQGQSPASVVIKDADVTKASIPTVVKRVSGNGRLAGSSSMPVAMATKSTQSTLHQPPSDYYTLQQQPYIPSNNTESLADVNSSHWFVKHKTDDLYSELFPLSSHCDVDARKQGTSPGDALKTFTGGSSVKQSSTFGHFPRQLPLPSWPLSDVHTQCCCSRLDLESPYHESCCRDRVVVSSNSSDHIYDEIYTEIGGSCGDAEDKDKLAVNKEAIGYLGQTAEKMAKPGGGHLFQPGNKSTDLITLDRLPFKRPCAKYEYLVSRLSETSINLRHDLETRYVDIETNSDGDDEVFVSTDHLATVDHDCYQHQVPHIPTWSSLGNISAAKGVQEQLRRSPRPSCGVWMAKLRATRRIYAELECTAGLELHLPVDSGTPVCNPSAAARENLQLPGQAKVESRTVSTSTQEAGCCCSKHDAKYVQTELSLPVTRKSVAGRQCVNGRGWLRRRVWPGGRAVSHVDDSSEEYEWLTTVTRGHLIQVHKGHNSKPHQRHFSMPCRGEGRNSIYVKYPCVMN
jgi:hypothetical protein